MKIVCLAPIKNEAWILDNFLKAASIWADYIIVADQNSTDKSKQIALKYKKVIYLKNTQNTFNESYRQTLLINAARKIPGSKVLIALDADEFLSANSLKSTEWKKIKKLKPGTSLYCHLCNVKPSQKIYWEPIKLLPCGFVDDNKSEVKDLAIHNARIPIVNKSRAIVLNDLQILHLQFVNKERMESKGRWYMCYEMIENLKPWWKIYVQYHRMHAVNKKRLKTLPDEWINGYKKRGIDILKFKKAKEYWWDKEVMNYFDIYGVNKFKMLDIWYGKWNKYNDPQSCFIKFFFKITKFIYPYIYRTYISLSKRRIS